MATIKMDVPTDTAHLAIILERWYDDAIRNQKVFGGQYGGELIPYRSHESGFDYTHSGHQIGLGIHGQPPNNRTALFRDLIHVDAYEITGQLTRLTLRGKPGYDDAVNDLAQFIEQHFTSQPIGSKSQLVAGEVSGSVKVDANNVAVGNDVVGRDKIIQVGAYIEYATIVQPAPSNVTPSTVGENTFAPPSGKASMEGTLAAVHIRRFGGMEFVRIPAGKFLMGSKEDNSLAPASEKPQHTVEIPYDYWLARYPVTNEQFAHFVEATQHITMAEKGGGWSPEKREYVKGFDWQHPQGPKSDLKQKGDHPVVQISWHDAMEYCKWLDTLTKADFPSPGLAVRLPTEAEWEKAARGEYGNEWPWGNEFDQNKCNASEGGKGDTTPVGTYSPQGDSPYGVADMVGNVWEWCHSLYKPYPYKMDDGREDEAASEPRVLRGGSFTLIGSARCAYRSDGHPDVRNDLVGFRVVVAPSL